ncbi:MAG: hypothetical protein Q9194_004738 [Teloschistes cf. exilis]
MPGNDAESDDLHGKDLPTSPPGSPHHNVPPACPPPPSPAAPSATAPTSPPAKPPHPPPSPAPNSAPQPKRSLRLNASRMGSAPTRLCRLRR